MTDVSILITDPPGAMPMRTTVTPVTSGPADREVPVRSARRSDGTRRNSRVARGTPATDPSVSAPAPASSSGVEDAGNSTSRNGRRDRESPGQEPKRNLGSTYEEQV